MLINGYIIGNKMVGILGLPSLNFPADLTD